MADPLEPSERFLRPTIASKSEAERRRDAELLAERQAAYRGIAGSVPQSTSLQRLAEIEDRFAGRGQREPDRSIPPPEPMGPSSAQVANDAAHAEAIKALGEPRKSPKRKKSLEQLAKELEAEMKAQTDAWRSQPTAVQPTQSDIPWLRNYQQ